MVAEIYEAVNDEPLPSATARDFLSGWAQRRKADTAARTQKAYAQVVRDFLASMGERAGRDVSQVSKADVARYRDAVLDRTSVATANKSLKYLRVALGAAYKDGLSQDNPAAKLDTIRRKEADRTERRPFTIPEIRALLEYATREWRGLVLFGFYTGQRLKDVANMRWSNVDLESRTLKFKTAKTGRKMELPIPAPLLDYLASLPTAAEPSAPLFPSAHQIASKTTGDSRLSQQFHAILVAAGLATERAKLATGKGRSIRRTVSQLSYHSFRHTFTSLLKNAGVSEAVAMDVVGHDSKAVSRVYTHIDDASKRAALAKLPDLTKPAKGR